MTLSSKKMRMESVEVEAEENRIFIVQGNGPDEGDSVILLHPDQVPLLVRWLSIAAKTCAENEARNA